MRRKSSKINVIDLSDITKSFNAEQSIKMSKLLYMSYGEILEVCLSNIDNLKGL